MESRRARLLFFTLFSLLAFAGAYADEADELAKKASDGLRAVERDMMGGKKEQAVEGLIEAAGWVEQLRKIAPVHAQLSPLDSKVIKLKKDLERRTGKTIDLAGETAKEDRPVSNAAAEPPQKKESLQAKLPGGVSHRLGKMEAPLKRAAELLGDQKSDLADDYRLKEAASQISAAKELMKEIEKGYADSMDHEIVKSMEARIAQCETLLNAFEKGSAERSVRQGEATAERDALCAEWIEKIGPYIWGTGHPGHDPSRYFISSATADAAELKERCRLFEEAKSVFDAMAAAEFKNGKNGELERAQEQLRRAVEDFPAAREESIGYILGDATKEIDQASAYLASEKEQAWRRNPEEKPGLIGKDRIELMETGLRTAAQALAPDHPGLLSARKKLAALVQENEARRRVRTERTRMTPDRFQGKESAELQAKAEEVVRASREGAEILRTAVFSEDWTEENVIEATDSTNTALRRRITRSVSAQVAAKCGEAVFLHTVHLAQDKRSDGSWGPLYGHIMFDDPMLESNVEK